MIRKIISKLQYLNRLIIDISNTSRNIIDGQRALVDSYITLQDSVNQLKENTQRFEESQNKILDELNSRGLEYINVEYLYLLNSVTPKILLVGFYGARNLGDELMLQKVYNDLNMDSKSVYVLMCDNRSFNAFLYPDMNILHYPKTKYDYSFLANQFDIVIFGGGAIIDDALYEEKDSYTFDLGRIYLELATAFIQKQKKVYSLGLSTSRELRNAEYITKISRIIEQSAYFSTRDKYSAKLLENITGHPINQINDIVLSYKTKEVPLKKNQKLTIGIIWICYENLRNLLCDLLEKILGFYDGQDYEIRLIPFYDYRDCDHSFYMDVWKSFSCDPHIIITGMPNTFDDVCGQLADCDLIISMRYHGALIGLMLGKETYSLLYEEHRHYYNKMVDIYEKFSKREKLFTSLQNMWEYMISIEYVSNSSFSNPPHFDNSQYEEAIKMISSEVQKSHS